MSMHTGILGGTFDPVHYGHLAIAEDARVALGLDRVLFIPAARQPLKQQGHMASPEQRLHMVRLACASNPAFEVSRVELDRPGLSYTLTTLQALRTTIPGELHFILGADALADLPRWYGVVELVDIVHIVAIKRPRLQLDLARLYHALPALENQLTLLEGPHLEISSTELRQRVAAGQPIRYQTPDAVVAYISEQGLYLPHIPEQR